MSLLWKAAVKVVTSHCSQYRTIPATSKGTKAVDPVIYVSRDLVSLLVCLAVPRKINTVQFEFRARQELQYKYTAIEICLRR
jgi:hypothetical protein